MKKILAIITVLACVGLLAGCKCSMVKDDKTTDEASGVATEAKQSTEYETDENNHKIIRPEPSTKASKETKKETAPQKNGKKKTKATGGNIVGSWTFEGGIFVYNFKKDGSGVFTSGSEAKHFKYTTANNKVTITYNDGTKVTMPYTVKGKTLMLKDENGDDMPYYKNKSHKNPNK